MLIVTLLNWIMSTWVVVYFCVSVATIQRRVEKLRKTFCVGRMRYDESGKEESKAVKEYKEPLQSKMSCLMCMQKTQK